jgi:hypothetical protein
VRRALARLDTVEKFRAAVRATWKVMLGRRAELRWRKIRVVGGAYARPDFGPAVAEAQDAIVVAFAEFFEPCQRRGGIHADIDVVSTSAWQISLLARRVHLEHGQRQGDPEVWDALTLDALERTVVEL